MRAAIETQTFDAFRKRFAEERARGTE
jgi:queuine/archaeosine tRNA-ribosyltransferase